MLVPVFFCLNSYKTFFRSRFLSFAFLRGGAFVAPRVAICRALFFPRVSLRSCSLRHTKKGGPKENSNATRFALHKGRAREINGGDMWLRPVPPKRTLANKSSNAARPHHAHARQTATRAAPTATRVGDHSGSSDVDDCVEPLHRAAVNVAAHARTAVPSKIAHMIAPVDAAGSAAQSSARRQRPPTALAAPAPQRAGGPRDPGRVFHVDRDAHDPDHKGRKPYGTRQEEHVVPQGRGVHAGMHVSHTARPLRASAQENAHAKQPLADAVATATPVATGHVPPVQPHQRAIRRITKGAVSVGKRPEARGIADHSPLSHCRDNSSNNNKHDDHNDDVDRAEEGARDGAHCSDTGTSRTPSTSGTDSGGDDEHEDHDSTEWAAFQTAALARARCDIAADQRRTAHRLADALSALRAVMERAWIRGQLVPPSSVADVEARARAFLRADCCCPWEPAVAPLRASLSALVGQLAIDRPQEPTPCFVALLDALTSSVRLIAASDNSVTFAADDPAQPAKQHAGSDGGPQRLDQQSRTSPDLSTHRGNDSHSQAVDDVKQDISDAPSTDVVGRRDDDGNSKDNNAVRDNDDNDKSPCVLVSHGYEEGSGSRCPNDAMENTNDGVDI